MARGYRGEGEEEQWRGGRVQEPKCVKKPLDRDKKELGFEHVVMWL